MVQMETNSIYLLENFAHVGEVNFFRAFRSDKNGIQKKQDFEVGDIVVLKKDLSRNKWPMARVVKTEPD